MTLSSQASHEQDALPSHSISPAESDSNDFASDHESLDGDEQDPMNSTAPAMGLRQGSDADHGNAEASQPKKPSSSAKDPSRPRRKKARRACYACQRAHLTCGDERPCQRCIKRGLQAACQDGVRKKAKYLQDAPNEVFLPGANSHYPPINTIGPGNQPPNLAIGNFPVSPPQEIPRQHNAPPFPFTVPQLSTTGQPLELRDAAMASSPFGAQKSPTPAGYMGASPPGATPMQSLVQAMETAGPPGDVNTLPEFTGGLLDANDLSQFNFDPASFNFGNHYGALEFGMLGHMSSTAEEAASASGPASTLDPTAILGTPGSLSGGFSSSASPMGVASGFPYTSSTDLTGWRPPTQPQSDIRQTPTGQLQHSVGALKLDDLDAVPISAASALASPAMSLPGYSMTAFDPQSASRGLLSAERDHPSNHLPRPLPAPNPSDKAAPDSSAARVFAPSRRQGDGSRIYENVTEPYSYTTGFHSLITYIQRRFPAPKTFRIAKALSSIRPSFISCTKNLDREDLIFMEKCFQRSLWEYGEFISACGTPTLVCRRTGEIAAVGNEFCILTGWKQDVLLGKSPNLNTNTTRPALPLGEDSGDTSEALARPHPVFLAEVLDDESVVEFYESFARLAFGDSRGDVRTHYKLLRYQPRRNIHGAVDGSEDGVSSGQTAPLPLAPGHSGGSESDPEGKRRRVTGIGPRMPSADVGLVQSSSAANTIECTCCWTVKRDIFDLPMMIVMNFLPIF